MHHATLLLCLLIAGSPAAREYRVRDVRFVGHPAFATDVLRNVLKDLRVQRRIPGVWTQRPRYDARAVAADLARLRSFYLSKGYFDARIAVEDVAFDGGEATITLNLESGPEFRVDHVSIAGTTDQAKIVTGPNREFPGERLCRCLLDARRVAETQGRIDFAVGLEVSDGGVTARVQAGSPYVVDRITFSGNYRLNESTLRRAMVLQERALFDIGKLRSSLERLNRSGLLEPIGADDVHIQRDPASVTADVTISVRERRRGYWSISGPIGATGLGSLQASISSRLPPWGRGVLEASTYYATIGLVGLPSPLARLFSFVPKQKPSPLLGLQRPYLPGQALLSGFTLSPKSPARTLVSSYGVAHLGRAARAALGSERLPPVPLFAEVQTSHLGLEAGRSDPKFLICEPPTPRQWLRRAGAYAADFALAAFVPF